MTATATLEEVQTYLGTDTVTAHGEDAVQDAYDAEVAVQNRRCTIPVATEDDALEDLAQALKRRVARNLALRRLPLMVSQGDADGEPVRISANDPEIRRLEAPFRKRTVG